MWLLRRTRSRDYREQRPRPTAPGGGGGGPQVSVRPSWGAPAEPLRRFPGRAPPPGRPGAATRTPRGRGRGGEVVGELLPQLAPRPQVSPDHLDGRLGQRHHGVPSLLVETLFFAARTACRSSLKNMSFVPPPSRGQREPRLVLLVTELGEKAAAGPRTRLVAVPLRLAGRLLSGSRPDDPRCQGTKNPHQPGS